MANLDGVAQSMGVDHDDPSYSAIYLQRSQGFEGRRWCTNPAP
ncbi:MAG: hypothetical protein ACJAZN_001810 [Planctomycetota bacterium]|jgi:hypothetical protein